MSTDILVDVGELRRVVGAMYCQVAEEPEREFHFPTGRGRSFGNRVRAHRCTRVGSEGP